MSKADEILTMKGKAEAQYKGWPEKGVLKWAYEFLDDERHPTTAENFISRAIYALAGRWGAYITDLPSDQWGAVVTEAQDRETIDLLFGGEYGGGGFSTYIECDQFENGFAATLKAYHDHYGPWRKQADDSST